jgi:hypothetical protein
VWRNWELVPAERLAGVAGAKKEDILDLGRSMGLPEPPPVSDDLRRRSYITVIRRNWHLLPREQLLGLLGWTAERLDFTLREDDFLLVKLGNSKPDVPPIRWAPPDEKARARAREIAAIVRRGFPGGLDPRDPPFAFVRRLSDPPREPGPPPESRFAPRFCYSYFALYGDPLLEPEADPYPEAYLARLSGSGVDGVWLQGVLHKLAPFPWAPEESRGFDERRKALNTLVERAKKHGIGIYLYLNEPRAWPQAFYAPRPELKGVSEGTHASLCTSHPEVRKYLSDAVESLLRAVPGLAGLFTITASENQTNCWSHGRGKGCPRCMDRPAADVIAEVNGAFAAGIRSAGSKARLIAWDWGWPDAAAAEIIEKLPDGTSFMSVSEWGTPIAPGGVKSAVGEYSISAVGPGPRAPARWALARRRGLPILAKIQAGTTWELSAVPYVPAVENVARHAVNLRKEGVDGLMLGWTLGGHPSPNLEVVAEIGRMEDPSPDAAMERVAARRYGAAHAAAVVRAWKECSAAFREFPFHIGTVYQAPLQAGPSNPLWEAPTGWKATMVGFPYDDLDGWRSVYPPETFAAQLEKAAEGFDRAARSLEAKELEEERRIMEACALHFRSAAAQARFVLARRALPAAKALDDLERIVKEEIETAKRLHAIRSEDSRIGFEASNHYYYMPLDLVEKVLNGCDLIDRWLPAERAKSR